MAIDDYLTVPEVCRRLSVHRNTVHRLVRADAFPGSFAVGRGWRIPALALKAYIERQQAERGMPSKVAAREEPPPPEPASRTPEAPATDAKETDLPQPPRIVVAPEVHLARVLGRDLAIYLPATADRPAEPAPHVMTEADVVRLLRLDEAGVTKPYRTLHRYREKGWLKATQIGPRLCYQLPDVVRFLELARDENPR